MGEFIESMQDGGIRLHGEWRLSHLSAIEREMRALSPAPQALDASGIEVLDTAGAWAILGWSRQGAKVIGLRPEHQAMLELVTRTEEKAPLRPKHQNIFLTLLIRVGKAAANAWHETLELLRFIGETGVTLVRILRHPKKIRFDSIVRHIDETGIDAIPIVALIAFLISVVLAYQGAGQLKRFGAEIFTINMVGISVLREMGVLLTAIMIAGRSGSAFTAEIGVMKVNEEVDAMRTIGLNPFEVLVLPRLMALAITLPVLTFLADLMGILGGGVICSTLLDISPQQYLAQLQKSVKMWDFWVGIIKAPVFAFLIAVVGCMRGMEVSGSAESVGRLTTISVVHSIFLVLLADALFAVLFTKLGI